MNIPIDFHSMTFDAVALHIQEWICNWVSRTLDNAPPEVPADAGFDVLGMDSMSAVSLILSLEDLTRLRLSSQLLWQFANPRALALEVARLALVETK